MERKFKGSLLSLTEAGTKKSKKAIQTLGQQMLNIGHDEINVDKMVAQITKDNTCNHEWYDLGAKDRYHKKTGKNMGIVMAQVCKHCGKGRHLNPDNGKAVAVFEDKDSTVHPENLITDE